MEEDIQTVNYYIQHYYIQRGRQLIQLKRYKEAAEECRHALQLEPKNSEAHTHLARALYSDWSVSSSVFQNSDEGADQLALVLEEAQKGVQFFSGFFLSDLSYAYYVLAFMLSLNGKHNEAKDATLKGLQVYPGDLNCKEYYAILLKNEGNDKEAEKHLREILQIDPEYVSTIVLLIEICQDRCEKAPSSIGTRDLFANYSKEDFAQWDQLTQQLLRLEPNDGEALFLRAEYLRVEYLQCYSPHNSRKEMKNLYQKAMLADPTNDQFQDRYNHVFKQKKDVQKKDVVDTVMSIGCPLAIIIWCAYVMFISAPDRSRFNPGVYKPSAVVHPEFKISDEKRKEITKNVMEQEWRDQPELSDYHFLPTEQKQTNQTESSKEGQENSPVILPDERKNDE